jgi:hypothetical protein
MVYNQGVWVEVEVHLQPFANYHDDEIVNVTKLVTMDNMVQYLWYFDNPIISMVDILYVMPIDAIG